MKKVLFFLLFTVASAVAQIPGPAAVVAPLQNVAVKQLSFPMQGSSQLAGLDPNLSFLVLDNELVGGVPHLLLKAPSGPNTFTTVTDLSAIAGGGVNGSGTTGTIPLWSTSSTIGNSGVTQSGSGVNTTLNFAGSVFNFTTELGTGNDVIQAPTVSSQPGAFIQLGTWSGTAVALGLSSGGTGVGGTTFSVLNNGTMSVIAPPQSTFANLPAPPSAAGQAVYCTNCAEGTNPCSTSGGTGAGTWAFSIGVPASSPKWKCL